MPVVPFTQRQGQTQSLHKVDPTFLMMAAAELHEAGRLVEPIDNAAIKQPTSPTPEDQI